MTGFKFSHSLDGSLQTEHPHSAPLKGQHGEHPHSAPLKEQHGWAYWEEEVASVFISNAILYCFVCSFSCFYQVYLGVLWCLLLVMPIVAMMVVVLTMVVLMVLVFLVVIAISSNIGFDHVPCSSFTIIK